MNEKLSRRELLQAAFAIPAAAALAGCPSGAAGKTGPGPLADLDATATAEAIARGELSVREAVEAAIRRAEAVEPRINAVVTEAYDRARASAAGAFSGPFAGVPTFVKDLDDVRGLPTHSGSRSFGLEPATGQGPYVDALERSGLVFLGKSSTPEFGLTASTEPLLHGPTRNPWNLEHSPGGSSGGAAALVAARVVPIAHATDGGGSIR
ncbi:MAG: amidase family protein, partial [Steroidobacteraceae bacterium]